METYFTRYDVKRLELYAQNMVDYHLIVDLLPSISRLFFLNQMDIQLSIVQSVSQLIDSQAILLTFMAYMANHFVIEILKYFFIHMYIALYKDKDLHLSLKSFWTTMYYDINERIYF